MAAASDTAMGLRLLNKAENEDVKIAAVELYELNKKFKQIESQYEVKKTKLTTVLKNFMYCNKGVDEFSFLAQVGTFSGDNKNLKVAKITPKVVTWDADKLEFRLPKEVSSQIIDKTYTIEDMNGLIKYLKSCGVNPQEFKKYIHVAKKVNVSQLEQLEELGELSVEDVKGCYHVQEKSSYLKLNILEEAEE